MGVLSTQKELGTEKKEYIYPYYCIFALVRSRSH